MPRMHKFAFLLTKVPHRDIASRCHPQVLRVLVTPFQLLYLLVVDISHRGDRASHIPQIPQFDQLFLSARGKDMPIMRGELDRIEC